MFPIAYGTIIWLDFEYMECIGPMEVLGGLEIVGGRAVLHSLAILVENNQVRREIGPVDDTASKLLWVVDMVVLGISGYTLESGCGHDV